MKDKEPLKFGSADERMAWDKFAAGFACRNDIGPEGIIALADALLVERRKRDQGHVNMATDAGPPDLPVLLDRIATALERGLHT
jgi:hypothetical protein